MKALRALGLYVLLTIALTWPLAARLRIMDPGDSAYFAWAMGWEVHALKTRPATLPLSDHTRSRNPLGSMPARARLQVCDLAERRAPQFARSAHRVLAASC